MRILFCNYEYPPLGGGGGVINALLAQELAKRHEVTVLTSRALGLSAESLENGVKIVRAPVFFRQHEAVASLSSMLSFIMTALTTGKKLLSQTEFDVINTHFVLPSGPVGDSLARYAGIPNVLTLHGGDLYDPSKTLSPHRHLAFRLWIRWLLRRSDIVVGQSRNTLENMRRYYTPEIDGLQVPLGIKKVSVAPASRAQYGFTDNEVLLVTVGRLITRKAIPQLVRMMGVLRSEPIRLLVIGSGPQEAHLKKLSAEQCLEGRVRFVGQVDECEKFRLLQMSDVYVSTSQHEGFGLVFLEAMSCGLPIVAYDQGGQTDFLQDNLTGYLLPLNDFEGFTASCRRLAQDRELRRKMRQENLRRVADLYVERCAERYEQIFEGAIQRHGLQRLVNLSSTKKRPLRLAEGELVQTATPSVLAAVDLVDEKKEKETLRQPGITL